MHNPFSLEDKTILVTGASSGIGRSIAIECSKMGAHLIITGRNKERLQDTFNQLETGNHIMIPADLTKIESVNSLIKQIVNIDGIVHAAGIAKPKPFQFLKIEDFEEVFNTNLLSPIILSNLLVKNKSLRNGGSIVFVSSIAGNNCSSFGGTVYGSSKAALNGAVKGMSLDLSKKRIRVNTIMPGMIDTGFFNTSSISEADIEEDKKKYPLGRYGKPEEIAYAAIYLLSDASEWITGSNLLMDGGFTLL